MDKLKNFLTVPRIIFVILGIVLLVEAVYAVRNLTSSALIPIPPPPPTNKAAVVSTGGKISLTAPQTLVKLGETVSVVVMIDTGSYTINGVDLIVRFDPKILEIPTTGLTKGKIMDEYPLISADAKTGLVSISGISNLKNGFTGKGQFALINFRAKASGKTSLIIDFVKNSTSNSNLVELNTSKNILDAVTNLELTIQ